MISYVNEWWARRILGARASTIFHFLTGKSRISQELKEMNYGPGMVIEGNFSKSPTAPEAKRE